MQARLYAESMSGATNRSLPKASKHDERELGRLDKRDYWLTITRTKLLMDLIFVCEYSDFLCPRRLAAFMCAFPPLRPLTPAPAYDLFNIKRGKKSIQTFYGLTSGILSSMKLFDRHRGQLLKKANAL